VNVLSKLLGVFGMSGSKGSSGLDLAVFNDLKALLSEGPAAETPDGTRFAQDVYRQASPAERMEDSRRTRQQLWDEPVEESRDASSLYRAQTG